VSKSSRRKFLTLLGVLALPVLAPGRGGVAAGIQARKGAYSAEVGLLYDTITFRLSGTLDESVDREAGRYDIKAIGEGDGIANRVESTGRLRDGRWTPERVNSWFFVKGRESRTDIVYDWATRRVSYKFRGETFFLRRLRVVEDTVTVPDRLRVDDALSILLNHADGLWPADGDGWHRTHIVRRRRKESEGPDDVDPNARAELAPFELKVDREKETGKPIATFDMTRFSSWARRDRPAKIVFDGNRRPESITTSLMLGTSVTIRFRDL
jgi:hypothetical protein